MNRIDVGSRILTYEERKLDPLSIERNWVGFCASCEEDLESLAYYSTDDCWLVSACCKNDHLVLMRYDKQWKWQADLDLESRKEKIAASSLSKEMLDAVFTAAEIRDMLACERGEPYVRQNIYRARAKYEKFEKLFGIKLEI